MNWHVFPTLLLGFACWWLGCLWARKATDPASTWIGWIIACAVALPGIAYVAYYSKLLGEPLWLYQLRSIPGSEGLASLAGFLAGWIQIKAVPRLKLSPTGKRVLVPSILAFGLVLPYLKPLLRPLATDELHERWEEGVCLQSTASTCGPASAATLLRLLGVDVSERELAKESFSSGRGTENWYLARALRKHGVEVGFLNDKLDNVSLPVVAGVKLLPYNSGHFIAVLERDKDSFVVADPLSGKLRCTQKELDERYRFTGFFMSFRVKGKN